MSDGRSRVRAGVTRLKMPSPAGRHEIRVNSPLMDDHPNRTSALFFLTYAGLEFYTQKIT